MVINYTCTVCAAILSLTILLRDNIEYLREELFCNTNLKLLKLIKKLIFDDIYLKGFCM